VTPRLFRVLLFIGACAVLLSASAKAEDTAGIRITVYNNYGYNAAPPLPGDNRKVGTVVVPAINQDFDSQPLFYMYEDFAVKYEGFITAPCTCPVEFMAQADDGTKLYLDGVLITNDWRDKGGGGSVSQPVQFQEGVSKQITLWFYENGGGAWVELWWMVENEWMIVPDSAFSTMAVWTTTTTTTTTVPPTTEPLTTSSSSTSSSTTTTLPDPTTTTSTLSLATSTLPSTTTTVSPSSSTASSTSSSIVQTTTTMIPTTTSTIASEVTVSVPEASSSTSSPPTTQVTTTTIQNGNTVPEEVTPEQATELATNPEVLAEITGEEATQIFEALVVEDLNEEQLTALVAAVQDAPTAVRKAFEESINVFGGAVDTYVPVGSTVPVGTRRALIAINIMSSLMVLPTKRK
jgi:hypothetical protein